jgi:16S rRNA (adenine1518-N6/adenine1519-N6)-dimethyltransferase
VRPKKSFGQSFLVDPALRDAVVAAAAVQPEDEVLEIGAGPGTLTVRLAGASRRLLAVELDRGLVDLLRDLVGGRPGVEIIAQDVLHLEFGALFPAGGHLVLGNIPYNLTGVLLRRLLDRPPRPRRLALVVQREVARRWTGASGGSLATVAAEVFTEPRTVLELPADAFWPRPRVDSSLVLMEVRDEPLVAEAEMAGFFELVEGVFRFRRKQLRGALARAMDMSGEEVADRLTSLGIDPARRPQTLDVAEWRAIRLAFRPLS